MNDQNGLQPRPSRRKGRTMALAGAGAAAVLLLAGVVSRTFETGKNATGACKEASQTIARLEPLVRDEVAAIALARPARPVPDLAFEGSDGQRRTMSDFRGRTVLLNLWATWCVPCRKEMPALDRLQKALGGPGFTVVAVNTDTARLDQRRTFLTQAGITDLAFYADASGGVLRVLHTFGLPTTLLIDADGCELGTLAGPAEWDSAEAQKLIEAATERKS